MKSFVNFASPEEECSKEDIDEHSGLEIAGEAKAAIHDVNEMEGNIMNDETLNDNIQMLNKDQLHVFDMITEHLLHQRQHEFGECTCASRIPLQLFMSGVGGTGKSFLIDVIEHQVAAIGKMTQVVMQIVLLPPQQAWPLIMWVGSPCIGCFSFT